MSRLTKSSAQMVVGWWGRPPPAGVVDDILVHFICGFIDMDAATFA